MRILRLWIAGISLFFAIGLHAQDLAGTWQGTLKADKDLRMVLKIAKGSQGDWKAEFYSIDQPDQATDPRPVSSFSFRDGNVNLVLDQGSGSYEGRLSPKGDAINGRWRQDKLLPLRFVRATRQTAWQIDPTPHKVQFITVERGVRLEVIDWGGSGRPLVLIPGLGDTAHVFDQFALKLTPNYHVYGITRRGYGASSEPQPIAANYSSDRLGDDVVSVIDTLKLDRPILAGHSIAGGELSSVGTRHPAKVSALIYIDAGYSYALYDKAHGDLALDAIAIQHTLDQSHPGSLPLAPKQLIDELVAENHQIEQDLQQREEDLPLMSAPHPVTNPVSVAVLDGQQKYTRIDLPVLAIFNVPHETLHLRTMENQAKAFETQVPHAQIIRIPNAGHYVFETKEADVVHDINAFIDGLQASSTVTTRDHVE